MSLRKTRTSIFPGRVIQARGGSKEKFYARKLICFFISRTQTQREIFFAAVNFVEPTKEIYAR